MNITLKLTYLFILVSTISVIVVCSEKSSENKDTSKVVSFEDSTVVAIVNNEAIYFNDVDFLFLKPTTFYNKHLIGIKNNISWYFH